MLFQVLFSCVRVLFYKFILYFTFDALMTAMVINTNDTARLVAQLLSVALAMSLETIYAKKKYKIRFSTINQGSLLKNLILCIWLGIGFNLFNNWVFKWNVVSDYVAYLESNSKIHYNIIIKSPILIIYSGIFAPAIEELFFRGIIHNRLETKYSLTATCIITAVIWALFHNLWYTYLYVIPIGIVISFVYTKRKNILFPIAIHIGNNLFNLIGRAFGWYGLINQKAVGVGFIMIVIGIVVFCMQITKEEVRL